MQYQRKVMDVCFILGHRSWPQSCLSDPTFEVKLLEFGNFGKAGDDQFLSALRLPIAAMEKGNSRPMNLELQSLIRSISRVRSENQQQKHNV
jgi:hypothetical protein